MTTLTHEKAFLSINGPTPFGIERIILSDDEKNIFMGAFITHHFDAVHVYKNSADYGPAYGKYRLNACTGRDYTYNMMENGEEVTIRHVSMPVVLLGNINITKLKATSSFQNIGFGYNYDLDISDEDKKNIGNIEFGTTQTNLVATMIVREVTRQEHQLSLHYELHVCLT